jgi:hypothetical protein
MIPLTQAIAEPTSAILCFILVLFMLKPYRLTGEASFLGLPIGFGIMGIGHVLATAAAFYDNLSWYMLVFRTFSFVFLAITYLFTGRSSKKSQQLWNVIISTLIVALIALSFMGVVSPNPVGPNFNTASIYCRVFIEVCLLYIIFYTLRSHLQKPDPNTLWIPLGFILLAISQYSFIFYTLDHTNVALWGGLVFRFVGLFVFIVVSYRTLYSKKEFE